MPIEPGAPRAHPSLPRQVKVCVSSCCRSHGSAEVLEAFHREIRAAKELLGMDHEAQCMGCSCAGGCGSGPTVLILPDLVWYHHVTPSEVPAIVSSHLLGTEIRSRLRASGPR